MNPVISWTLIIIACALIVALAITTVIIIGNWLTPKVERLNKGIKTAKGWAPCCPAGLGCNDPDQQNNKCLRTEARRIATVDELILLDKTWAAYSAVPTKKKKQKATAHSAYNAARDSVVARALQDMADTLNASRHMELPANVARSRTVKGEVMDDDKGKQDYSSERWA